MKFRVTFKTPDATDFAIRKLVDGIENVYDQDRMRQLAEKVVKKWVKHDEYITVEFDLETGEAKVIPA